MYWFSVLVALLVSVGIIAIRGMYLARPPTALRSSACRFREKARTPCGGSA